LCYCDRLGHELVSRRETAAGLRVRDTEAEIVLTTNPRFPETDRPADQPR
jgi:hypothetical protein